MSADDINLLPCPFCGGSAHLEEHPPHQHVIIDMPYHAGSATVECGGCEAGMIAETAGAVADAWNRRAPSPQGDARDGARLDWLEKYFTDINGIYQDAAGEIRAFHVDCEDDSISDGDRGRVRTAIDAARSTPATEKGE
ncbi:MAG: hypothetical protein E2576_14520 [Alcaligenaceae bacterium]|nr:hypothetical protein [Alcaligenaceae bacterium SAGV5]MPS50405.1 hypothetical protein [Alcaligenaceae bacterium SAGV3]MPT57934.1 hypothetical protein [Alcaligenaceae bacterium]